MLHDVNAKFTGRTGGDGLTSGACPAPKWKSFASSHLKALSINVYGIDGARKDDRSASIVDLIKKADAEFVALQEAEHWFVKNLVSEPYIKSYYQWTDYGDLRAPGGLFILSKMKIESVKYAEQVMPGQVEATQRGKLLTVTILVGERPLVVANTHLDWRNSDHRVASLDFLFSVLSPHPDVLLLGDFNFDHQAEPETSRLPPAYVDVWTQLHPNEPGYTWDPTTNSYAKLADSTSRPSRIDRAFIRSSQWLAMSIKLAGCSAIDLLCDKAPTQAKQVNVPDAPSAYPSTHYGLLVEATRFTPHC